jgi:hypothetical protein
MSEHPQIVGASDEHVAEPPLQARAAIAGAARGSGHEASPHSHKFKLATGVLIGLAIGALAVAAVLLARGGKTGPSQAWSSWSPPDGGTQGAREIADHVAPLYRISDVDQLAVVTVVNLSSQGNGLQVAVRTDPSKSDVSLLSGRTIAYDLCGIGGTDCAIGVGTPSSERLLLLRREALELALYTFKYIHGTENVVTILPPGHTSTTSTLSPKPPSSNATSSTKPVSIALLFIRDELRPFLSHPVSDILPEEFPPSVSQMRSAPEAGLVDQITARGLFQQQVVQAQDGTNLIVLQPLPPQ